MLFGFKKNKTSNRRPESSSGPQRTVPVNNYYRGSTQQKTPSIKSRFQDSNNNDTPSSFHYFQHFSISKAINSVLVVVLLFLFISATTLSAAPIILMSQDERSYRPLEEYSQAASKEMESNLAQRSKLLFRSNVLESAMLEKFPELNNVQAIVPLGGRSLDVVLQTSEPLARVFSGSESGIVDTRGILVSQDSSMMTDTNLPVLRFARPLESFSAGNALLTSSETSLLLLLRSELQLMSLTNQKDLQIQEILFNVADGQMEVRIAGLPYFIKFSTYGDGAEQIGSMKVTLEHLNRNGNEPTKYLDVRVSGRVFVL